VIAERLGIQPSSPSFHLAQFVHADLIAQRCVSRQLIYSVSGSGVSMTALGQQRLVARLGLGQESYGLQTLGCRTVAADPVQCEAQLGVSNAMLGWRPTTPEDYPQ
jgi:hypothetical protein